MKHNPTLKMEYQEPLPHPTHLKRERERVLTYKRNNYQNQVRMSGIIPNMQQKDALSMPRVNKNKLIPMTITISIC